MCTRVLNYFVSEEIWCLSQVWLLTLRGRQISQIMSEFLRIHLAELQPKVSIGTEQPISIILATVSGIVTPPHSQKNNTED